ncbi:MAG: hypothetical protein ACI30A_07880 [Paludibacteraceae bacterium]
MAESFYSTSQYRVEHSVGGVYRTSVSREANTSFSAMPAAGRVTEPGAEVPEALYAMALQPGMTVSPEDMSVVAYAGRPTEPPQGGMLPLGDALCPLLVCVLVYGVWKMRHNMLHPVRK